MPMTMAGWVDDIVPAQSPDTDTSGNGWIDTRTGIRPVYDELVWYALSNTDVRLGTWDGTQYNETYGARWTPPEQVVAFLCAINYKPDFAGWS